MTEAPDVCPFVVVKAIVPSLTICDPQSEAAGVSFPWALVFRSASGPVPAIAVCSAAGWASTAHPLQWQTAQGSPEGGCPCVPGPRQGFRSAHHALCRQLRSQRFISLGMEAQGLAAVLVEHAAHVRGLEDAAVDKVEP